jgi:hypothetical protein
MVIGLCAVLAVGFIWLVGYLLAQENDWLR